MKKTVMVVEDEVFFRELLRDILEKGGYSVIAEVADGADALAMYREKRPDIVLMDIFMPGKNGIATTQEIISFDPEATIFMCSGVGYDDDIQAALQAGAKGVILKPFFPDEILQVIGTAS